MKQTFGSLMTMFLLASPVALAMDHQHHVKHNMILMGENEVFASHLVYKVPHNYQVLVRLQMDPPTRFRYLQEKKKFPQDQFILLLDEMNIAEIRKAPSISGTLFRANPANLGQRVMLIPKVTFGPGSFSVLFLDEVPLSLK